MAHSRTTHAGPMQDAIDACRECEQACHATVAHCLERGGRHAESAHVLLLLDCSSVCWTAASFMVHESPHHAAVCGVCAEVCDACARDCDTFGDDEAMRECAEVCRRCASECRRMATMA